MSERAKFEILCVTMNQHDFSKIMEMNIHSNVVFANQCDHTSYEEIVFDEVHTARMISTTTRGVGINRNIAFMYGGALYCLLADDDLKYVDNVEEIVLKEFYDHPDADVIIFHFDTDSESKKKKYNKTRRITPWEQMPWGGVRIALKLDSVRKHNIWFNSLFGGGCVFPSGEDSLWLRDARRKGLVFYVSQETIGTISFDDSSWFTGFDEKFYFGKGAFCAAINRRPLSWWGLYYYLRTRKNCMLSRKVAIEFFYRGVDGYDKLQSFDMNENR